MLFIYRTGTNTTTRCTTGGTSCLTSVELLMLQFLLDSPCLPTQSGLLIHGAVVLLSLDLSCLVLMILAHNPFVTVLSILDLSESRNLPLLGVCRGMQLMGCRSGVALTPVTAYAGQCHSIDMHNGVKLIVTTNSPFPTFRVIID
jgi:hypothetical protein